jgi:type IV pilus assembly protein PilO
MAITLSLDKMPWYGQVGTFVLLGLAGAGAFWYEYAAPTQQSIEVRRTQLTMLQADVKRGQDTAARLPEFRREVADLEAELERLRAVLPEERDASDLLRRVQAMATESNLRVRGFTPRAEARKQLHAEWPIDLQLEGTYHDLGAFLERVSRFPRIINVDSLSIHARENQTGSATIRAECRATTFVLLEPSPAQASPATAPAPVEKTG